MAEGCKGATARDGYNRIRCNRWTVIWTDGRNGKWCERHGWVDGMTALDGWHGGAAGSFLQERNEVEWR